MSLGQHKFAVFLVPNERISEFVLMYFFGNLFGMDFYGFCS
jgi:hypothetical protein